MERRHDRTAGPEGGWAYNRHQRLVHMENVEVGGSIADQAGDIEPDGEWHHRAIGPDRSNSPNLGDAIRVVGDRCRSRSDDCDFLPGYCQQPSDVENLLLDSPGPSQVVWTDQADPHWSVLIGQSSLAHPHWPILTGNLRRVRASIRRPIRLQEMPLLRSLADHLLQSRGDEPHNRGDFCRVGRQFEWLQNQLVTGGREIGGPQQERRPGPKC